MPTTVNCPHCNKKVIWNLDSEFRPFCSERCRLQDLGAWFTEERKISDDSIDDLDELITALDKNKDKMLKIN
jgi:endogenous inhibitor of DNA gyrase (YacG/DUF329 family)